MKKGQQKYHLVERSSCYHMQRTANRIQLPESQYKPTYAKLGMAMILLLTGSLSLFACTTTPSATSSQARGGIGVPVNERTIAQRVLDESIEHTAKVNIYALDESLRDNSRLSVNSFYSEVLLTGEVPDASIKEEITKIVSSMPDVENLYNRVNVSRPRGSSYTLHDSYITSKIVAKVIASRQIRNSQIKVVTDDGIVYVLGRLTPSEQGRLIEIVNNTVGIKELILLTTLVDDSGQILTKDRIMQESGLQPPSFDDAQSSYQAPSTPITNEPVSGSNNSSNHNNGNTANTPSPYVELYKNLVSGWQ